jgi:hypothetical protein
LLVAVEVVVEVQGIGLEVDQVAVAVAARIA